MTYFTFESNVIVPKFRLLIGKHPLWNFPKFFIELSRNPICLIALLGLIWKTAFLISFFVTLAQKCWSSSRDTCGMSSV